METELVKAITELLGTVHDTDLLDLVYKILLESLRAAPEQSGLSI